MKLRKIRRRDQRKDKKITDIAIGDVYSSARRNPKMEVNLFSSFGNLLVYCN